MQKVVYIFIVLFIVSCSVSKKRNSDVKLLSERHTHPADIIEGVRKLNISNQSYFIRKAEVQVVSDGEKQSFLASVKFVFPDKYLISLRSKSGVEGARVFLTGDTVLINDRISRELLYGDPDFIRKKFGISSSVLPLFFGDFVFMNLEEQDSIECDDGYVMLHSSVMGSRYEIVVDCELLKIKSCIQMNDKEEDNVGINYSKHLEIGERIVPTKINLKYGNIQVLIVIKNIEMPWEGEIEFIPGTNYEVIPLK